MKKALIVFMPGAGTSMLRKLVSALSCASFSCHTISRNKFLFSKLNTGKFCIIITLGGDGTFLSVAHNNRKIPMLGVNPEPKKREGFFCRATLENFDEKMGRIAAGDFKIKNLMRISCTINGKSIPDALNEIYFGAKKPYHSCRYILHISRSSEFQLSSGIIVASPAGSHAWLASAGGRKLPLSSQKMQFIVREPYMGTIVHHSIQKGSAETVKIIPIKNRNPVLIALDSIQEFQVRNGDSIIIQKSKFSLPIIEF
ncbi:hypothetical protein COV21_01095 [Candidatus Woesearchaeota archaeon CG10_big_fil_rev_8_21_14_0_10_45_5]|nr:MAG: hypothetical protein COV21_01095 [Candidatus Woesearchaeota archaeon CG10_big_fil_rev_8_21_14_0_10_45_5]PIU30540.1 MAG: hypothetical protein COT07_00115 [Candidatus Woesearchaeota archaeon CG07_land_8_20_14_0_80_44_23]